MTIEERQQEYELKLNDNKLMRKTLDEDTSNIRFNNTTAIKTIGDIIFHGIILRSPTGFYDSSLVYIDSQCSSGKRRTIEDIYKIQKSYGLKLPYKQVKQCLEELVKGGLIEQVFCKSTYTRTHGKRSYSTTIEDINNYLDKLDLTKRKITKPIKKKTI